MKSKAEILVVEDTAPYAEMMLIAFEKRGWRERTIAVRDGAEALDYLFCTGAHAGRLDQSLPKVVLLDLHLPKLDGKDVLAQLREDAQTCALPVFMMTGSDDDRDIAECRRLGIEGYIVKPARFTALIERLGCIAPYLTTGEKDQ